VLKVWSKRYRDLGRARTQVGCRLHTVLAELVPGGMAPGDIAAIVVPGALADPAVVPGPVHA
jgi:hypothetical protein